MTNKGLAFDPGGEGEPQTISHHLHQLAERLEATGNFLDALRNHLREAPPERAVEFADTAAEQAALAMEAFHRLRRRLESL